MQKWCYSSNERRYANYIAPDIQLRNEDIDDVAHTQEPEEILSVNHATLPVAASAAIAVASANSIGLSSDQTTVLSTTEASRLITSAPGTPLKAYSGQPQNYLQ